MISTETQYSIIEHPDGKTYRDVYCMAYNSTNSRNVHVSINLLTGDVQRFSSYKFERIPYKQHLPIPVENAMADAKDLAIQEYKRLYPSVEE